MLKTCELMVKESSTEHLNIIILLTETDYISVTSVRYSYYSHLKVLASSNPYLHTHNSLQFLCIFNKFRPFTCSAWARSEVL